VSDEKLLRIVESFPVATISPPLKAIAETKSFSKREVKIFPL
jgi:hypothetical protein